MHVCNVFDYIQPRFPLPTLSGSLQYHPPLYPKVILYKIVVDIPG